MHTRLDYLNQTVQVRTTRLDSGHYRLDYLDQIMQVIVTRLDYLQHIMQVIVTRLHYLDHIMQVSQKTGLPAAYYAGDCH